jgi:thiamine transport system substrate-binding protein
MKTLWVILLTSLVFTACTSPAPAPTPSPTPAEPAILKVMSHDSFNLSESVLDAFQSANNVTVQFVKAGDTGAALNKAILSKDVPLADVFYGVDNTFLSRALEEGIFASYDSPLLAAIPDQFELDPQHYALPVDYGDVCLNYDKGYFAEKKLPPPQNLQDLLEPEYKSLLVVENPATSSPGLAFLLVTLSNFGEEGYLEYWRGLVANDVLVVEGWDTAYNTEFSRWGGTRPIVVSYGSSPPFEVIYAEAPMEEPPTAAVVSDGACFRQIEFVGILRGTQQRALAEKWVDFMLSTTFQEDMPLQMYVFPVNQNASLDETFVKFLALPQKPASLAPAEIAANREKWLREWTEAVLR